VDKSGHSKNIVIPSWLLARNLIRSHRGVATVASFDADVIPHKMPFGMTSFNVMSRFATTAVSRTTQKRNPSIGGHLQAKTPEDTRQYWGLPCFANDGN
jgi:hypothetical protein